MFNDQLSGDGDNDRDEKCKQMGVYCSETVTNTKLIAKTCNPTYVT